MNTVLASHKLMVGKFAPKGKSVCMDHGTTTHAELSTIWIKKGHFSPFHKCIDRSTITYRRYIFIFTVEAWRAYNGRRWIG